MAETINKCSLCGEPMPPGEEMFLYHGYSGPCPVPPLKKDTIAVAVDRITAALRPFLISDCKIALRRALTALGEPTFNTESAQQDAAILKAARELCNYRETVEWFTALENLCKAVRGEKEEG